MREGVKLSAIRPDRNGGRQQAQAVQPGSAGREAGGLLGAGRQRASLTPSHLVPFTPV